MQKNIIFIGCFLIGLSGVETAAQEKQLVIWSHWKDEPVKVSFMQTIADRFEQKYGIPVKFRWFSKIDLLEQLRFALNTPEPDITYLDASFTYPYIWRVLLPLHDLQITGQTNPTWKLGCLGEGRNNYLPIEGLSRALYYNKRLFEQAKISLPPDRTITNVEFLEIVRKLRAAGITPIGEGTADRTVKAGGPIINTIFRYAGPEKIDHLFKGEIDFSDPDVVAALNFWKQVIDVPGYDVEKILNLTLSEGIFEVTDGRAAISFCGTYVYGKYGTTARDQGQIGVLDWFTVENGKGNNYYELIWSAGYGINRNSPHLEDAKKFLEELLTPASALLWIEYVQMPYPVLVDKMPADSLYSELARQRQGQQPVLHPFTNPAFTSKAARQMWEDETRRFVLGEHTVEQFIQRMNSRLREF